MVLQPDMKHTDITTAQTTSTFIVAILNTVSIITSIITDFGPQNLDGPAFVFAVFKHDYNQLIIQKKSAISHLLLEWFCAQFALSCASIRPKRRSRRRHWDLNFAHTNPKN